MKNTTMYILLGIVIVLLLFMAVFGCVRRQNRIEALQERADIVNDLRDSAVDVDNDDDDSVVREETADNDDESTTVEDDDSTVVEEDDEPEVVEEDTAEDVVEEDTTEEDSSLTVEQELQKAFATKYDKEPEDIQITIDEQTTNHVKGGVILGDPSVPGNGGVFWATNIQGYWEIVHDGQSAIGCDYAKEYEFPDSMIEDCI